MIQNQEKVQFVHIPVLSQEIITGLNIQPGGHYLDATLGGGGHSSLILAAFPDVKLTGIDRDLQAIAATKRKLADYGEDRFTLIHSNYANYQPGEQKFDGIIADLGVSSAQFDLASRGFSFQQESDLDMRMDGTQSLTAAAIINQETETELARIFYEYGEERLSRRLAKAIVNHRPLFTTTELANLIARNVPVKYRYGRIHPATRVFQALRIAVNQELQSLEIFLTQAPNWLKIGGRIGMISFHSLEDRLVKHQFRNSVFLKVLTKKPIIPQEAEIQHNPRSRSAKLRFAERINEK
jgi:16S rRNA (cytosine1402-N4)-methyltransferase